MTGEQIYNEVQHIENKKNVAESLVGTLLNVLGKMKDGVNARLDLAELGVKPELFAMQEEDKTTLPPAENEHSKSFAKWFRKEVERELAISKESVSETVRWISYGPRATVVKYDAYNINGAGGVKRDTTLGYTLVDLNNLGHKVDPFILASQAQQVFYVKDQIDKKLYIVFKTPPKNYKDMYDEVDEEFSTVIHQHNDNILPRVDRRDLGMTILSLGSGANCVSVGDSLGIDEVVLEVLLLEVDFDGALSGERDLSLGNGDGVLTSRFSSL
ncbi:reverse transcriptase domain-containing protein [Tanacetum coccineum]